MSPNNCHLIEVEKMNLDDLSRKTIPELIKALGLSPFVCFLFVSLIATVVALPIVEKSGVEIDTRDPGVILIMTVTATLAYGSIWIFIKRLTASGQG